MMYISCSLYLVELYAGHDVHIMYAVPRRTFPLAHSHCVHFKSLGSLRGELVVWDVKHRQLIKNWMAHKRSAVNCVKFSNDTKQVYSCGEDTKV